MRAIWTKHSSFPFLQSAPTVSLRWEEKRGKNSVRETTRENKSKATWSIKPNKFEITLSVSVCDAGLLHTTLTKPHKAPLPCISPHWGYYLHTSLPSPPQPLPPHHVTLSHPPFPLFPQAALLVGPLQRLNWALLNHGGSPKSNMASLPKWFFLFNSLCWQNNQLTVCTALLKGI